MLTGCHCLTRLFVGYVLQGQRSSADSNVKEGSARPARLKDESLLADQVRYIWLVSVQHAAFDIEGGQINTPLLFKVLCATCIA